MRAHRTAAKTAGYLLSLLPQILLVIGTHIEYPWMCIAFFFVVLPIMRALIGDDFSAAIDEPSRWHSAYLIAIPRLYFMIWVGVLPWCIWVLAVVPMTISQHVGFAASLWIVCSLNTAVAHELIHSGYNCDRTMGALLDATVGYFHFAEEHLSHHKRTGHYFGGDAAIPGISIYKYAVLRYAASLVAAWEYETARHRRRNLRWYSRKLLRKALIPIIIAAAFYAAAESAGLMTYIFEVMGTAFTVQAITYLQHWGLSERETPELAEYGFSWEDGCWLQACITLNHAYHAQHHLHLRRPYYCLTKVKYGLTLPGSYPVMFAVALIPPLFTSIMQHRLAIWISNDRARVEQYKNTYCIGAVLLHWALSVSSVTAAADEKK